MTFEDHPKVKRGHAFNMSTSSLLYGHFISLTPNFHRCETKDNVQNIFCLFFCMMTYDDLLKVKQGHITIGSISDLGLHGMNKIFCMFHDRTVICKIVRIECIFMTS